MSNLSRNIRQTTTRVPFKYLLAAALIALWTGSCVATAAAQTFTAKACTDDQGVNRAVCVAMIGAERSALANGKTVCSPLPPDDMSDTYAVIDWIRGHPNRQDEEIGSITEEVLKALHPCD